MKILQIAHGLYPYANGGVEIYTEALSRELIRRGHEVLVAAPVPGRLREALAPSVPLFPLPGARRAAALGDVPRRNRRRALSSLRDAIDRFRPDVLHVQHLYGVGWDALAALVRLGVPFVVSLHDYWYLCGGIQRLCGGLLPHCVTRCAGIPATKPLRFLTGYWRARRRRARCLDLLNGVPAPLVSVSHRAAAIYMRAGVRPGRIVVHPPGIDPSGRSDRTSAPSGGSIRFGYIGSLTEAKGVDALIRAFQGLCCDAVLHVYGHGEPGYLERLQRLAVGARVVFHGPCDHREIWRVLANLDVIVIPSVWEEAYGLIAQEALAARAIVIASAVGGLQEQIIHGVNGFLCPPGEPHALSRRMSQVAANYRELAATLRFDTCLHDIAADAERMESLYGWTIDRWEGLRRGTVLPVEWEWKPLEEMLAAFLKADTESVRRRLKREFLEPGISVRAAWEKARPGTDEEILEFYRSDDCYLYDLSMAHRSPERRAWRAAAISLLVKYGIRTLLDYGGGAGDDSLEFARLGIESTLYDVGRFTTGFAKARAAQSGVALTVLTEPPEGKTYDGVYCTEVLEHVPDPLGEVTTMARYLAPRGILILTHSFELVGHDHPSHLDRHRGLSLTFVSDVERLGFDLEEVLSIPGNRMMVFRKSR